MSAIYSDPTIQAQSQWLWKTEETSTDEPMSRFGATMAALQQIGLDLADTLSTILAAPFSAFTARQGTTDISSRVEDAIGHLALQGVSFSRLADIRSYLLQNSDLLDLLPAICRTISERFDPNTKQQLEYYQDPQYEDDQYLCLYLRSEPFDLSLVEKIDGVTDAYSQAFANVKGWILITPDFRRR